VARSGVTGDFGKMKRWQELFRNNSALMIGASRSMAEETLNLIKDGFRSEQDPYGKAWAPKQANDGRKVLSGKTSRLKGGWHVVSATASGFRVAPSVDYAAPHQSPRFGRRPRRMMIPTSTKGMPNTWARALNDTVKDIFTAYYTPGKGGTTRGLRVTIRRAASGATS
jgi:phage gpG-like protein